MLCVCWGWCALSVPGCGIFPEKTDVLSKSNSGLPALPVSEDAVELEVMFVERPTGDRLLGETLWKDVDTILSSMEPQEQRDLIKNGFRIGLVGSHPPETVQQLLSMRAKPREGEVATAHLGEGELQGNRVFVRSGGETQIQLNDVPYPEFGFKLFSSFGSSEEEQKHYHGARCLYRVKVLREQPGWVRLEFSPEIHHGMDQLRPIATTDRWELSSQPNIERMHPQRFSLVLNSGDMALVTGRDDMPGTLGHRLFTGPEGQDSTQRLLIVRVARVGKSDQPFVSTTSLGSR